jgi:hypothetical protein
MIAEIESIHYPAIVVATIVSLLLGAIWYSPFVFGKAWIKEMHLTRADLKRNKEIGMWKIYFGALICTFLAANILCFFIRITHAHTALTGGSMGALASLGLVATSSATNYLFQHKSAPLFMITMGHHLVSFIAMGAILGYWK